MKRKVLTIKLFTREKKNTQKNHKQKNQVVWSPEINGFGKTSKWLHAEQKKSAVRNFSEVA